MRRKTIVTVVLLLFIILSGCANKQVQYTIPKGKSDFSITSNYSSYSNQEKKLVQFINKKMLTKKGIYTNVKKQAYDKNQARGHELLSESSGFWLEYLVTTHQYKKFRHFYNATVDTFDQGSQFSYRYIPSSRKKFNVNATIDDLRIIKALQMYADATGNTDYKKKAARRFALLKKNTMSRGKIASFYDVKARRASDESSLAYYDFLTLKYFESATKVEKSMYAKQLSVVKHGYLGDAFPVYASSYNWQSKSYSNADLNTSEALETILHLAEIGQVKAVTLTWLKRQVNENSLYNTYSVNGNIVDKSHSAGSYALAAMIFATTNNRAMYHKSMNLVWKYQVSDDSSPIYGGIGIEKQNEAYSYNNLTALIAAKY